MYRKSSRTGFTRQNFAKKISGGFTLIELLVVIAVIGILASVVLASLNSARKKGADAKIKSELKQIATALELYYDKYGAYVVTGTGYLDGGQGYARFVGGSYSKAVTTKLAEEGFLGSSMSTADTIEYGNYMIYVCVDSNGQQHYSLSATLNNPTAQDIAHVAEVCSGGHISVNYGKNYAIGN